MLFDHFWYENELCILFADTNAGKSVLAVQIADSISRGRPIAGMQLTAQRKPVVYVDFELTDGQFRHRYYSKAHGNYPFHKTFSRAVPNPAANKMRLFATWRDYLENELENTLLLAKAKVLIIDNITCLKVDTHAAASALYLVQYLQTIKVKYNIAILVLAHTPKRNPVKPVTGNDLQGSKMLLNYCDSAFAIAHSQHQPNLRYLKQIKQRSAGQQYGADNVCVGHISREQSFLQFNFSGHSPEAVHLAPITEQYRKNTEARVTQLHAESISMRQIAAKLSIAPSTVHAIIKRAKEMGSEL